MSAVTDRSIEQLEADYSTASAAEFKQDLTDVLVATVDPIRLRMQELLAGDRTEIRQVR